MRNNHLDYKLDYCPVFHCKDCGFSFKILNKHEEKDLCPNCGRFNSYISGDLSELDRLFPSQAGTK